MKLVNLFYIKKLVSCQNKRQLIRPFQDFDVYAYRNYSSVLSLPWTGFWLIGPFGLLGLVLTRRLSKNQQLILIYTVIGILSILPFKASDRYPLPSAVLLAMFAALTLWHFYQWIKNRNLRPLFAGLPVIVLLCLLCWPDWQNIAARKSSRHYFFIGKYYETSGRMDAEIEFLKKAVAKTGNYQPAMLLALRFSESGNVKESIELYDKIMRSRQVAKRIRLSAAMRAGMTIARFLNDAEEARRYWQYIVREFNEFKFFSLQASFMAGDLDEKSFRKLIEDTPEGQVTAEYIVGLRYRLNGNTTRAIQAYRRCLQIDTGDYSFDLNSPRT